MDSKMLIAIFGFIAILSLFFLFFGQTDKTANKTINIDSTNKIILYWGIGCPHCQKVKEFIEQNQLRTKITIIEKEVYNNKTNAEELIEAAKSCLVDQNKIGIPFLLYNNKCYIGSDEAINLLNSFLK